MRFEDVILWHVYPLGFTGAERENPQGSPVQHRLPQLERWLDHLIDLGANGLQLGPVFDSETHGYDTRDHLRIDPRLGDEDDLRSLIAAAHDHGVKVVLDGVFNHVGRSFPRFVAAEAGDQEAARWFVRAGDGWADFEGHSSLVALNHDEPAVLAHVVAVMRHWLDLGIDGWRLDAAYAVPTAFWRRVSDEIHASHPHAWLLGEVIHGDYAEFVAESGLDSVTQYELWKAIWSGLNERNLWETAWSLGRHAEMVASFLPATFVGNHDTTRIASKLDDPRHLAHALTVLLTVGGTPVVYAGDEEGFRGVKEDRAGGDDAVRPQFPDDPSGLSEDGAPILRLHQRLISLRRRKRWLAHGGYEQLSVENAVLVYRMTAADASDAVTVVLNIGDQPAAFTPEPGERLLEGGIGPHEAGVFGRE
jgi:cyclomaltodextrinase